MHLSPCWVYEAKPAPPRSGLVLSAKSSAHPLKLCLGFCSKEGIFHGWKQKHMEINGMIMGL